MLLFPMEPETPFPTERYEFGRRDLPEGFSLSKRIRAKKVLCAQGTETPVPYLEIPEAWGHHLKKNLICNILCP